jgi:hypothetical protein
MTRKSLQSSQANSIQFRNLKFCSVSGLKFEKVVSHSASAIFPTRRFYLFASMLPDLSIKRGVTAAAHDGGWRSHVHPGSARSHVHQLRQLKQQAIEHAPRRVRTSAMDDKPLTPCSARTCTSESSSSASEWSADEWSYATRGERPDSAVASVGPDVIATMAAPSEAAGVLSLSANQRPANDGSHARSAKDHAPPSAAAFSPSGSGRGIEELRRRLEALKAEQPMKAEYAAGPLL